MMRSLDSALSFDDLNKEHSSDVFHALNHSVQANSNKNPPAIIAKIAVTLVGLKFLSFSRETEDFFGTIGIPIILERLKEAVDRNRLLVHCEFT